MTRRGLTLLELLIVLGLLLAIGAIALPSLRSLLARQSFEAAVERAQQQLLMARAHAQVTGKPVEVVYRAESRTIEARLFLIDEGEGPVERESLDRASGDHDGDDIARGAEVEGAILEPWAVIDLPRGVKLSREAPDAAVELAESQGDDAAKANLIELAGDAASSRLLDSMESAEEDPLRLAVLLPDGTAMLTNELWIADEDGRFGRLIVNPWTGAATFESLPPPGSAPQAEEVAEADGELPSEDAADPSRPPPPTATRDEADESEDDELSGGAPRRQSP